MVRLNPALPRLLLSFSENQPVRRVSRGSLDWMPLLLSLLAGAPTPSCRHATRVIGRDCQNPADAASLANDSFAAASHWLRGGGRPLIGREVAAHMVTPHMRAAHGWLPCTVDTAVHCMTVWLYDCMTVWLYDCMTVWLHDCMTAWLSDCLTVCRGGVLHVAVHFRHRRHSKTFFLMFPFYKIKKRVSVLESTSLPDSKNGSKHYFPK